MFIIINVYGHVCIHGYIPWWRERKGTCATGLRRELCGIGSLSTFT